MKIHLPGLVAASIMCLPLYAGDAGANFGSGFENGFYIQDAEGLFGLRLNAFAQVRYTGTRPHGQNTRSTFDVALGRVSFSGTVYDPKLSYFVQVESSTLGDTSRVHLLDGWLQYQVHPRLNVQTGRLLLPYSRQFYTHPGELLFADLSSADYTFNLPRSTGIHAYGKAGRVGYHFAAANSIRALGASGQQNAGTALATVARVDFDILRPYGFLETSTTLVPHPQFSVGVAVASNPVVEASALQNVAAGDRTKNATADAGLRWRRLSAQSAVYTRWTSRQRSNLAGTRDWGAYVQAGFYVVPRRWEVTARISEVSFESALGRQIWGSAREYTAGVNRYFYDHHFKLQADCTRTNNARFSAGPAKSDHGIRLQGQLLF